MAALLSYWAYDIASSDDNVVMCCIGSMVCFSVTLVPAIGISYNSSRIGTNIRITSALFFLIFLISQLCFAVYGVKMPHYILVNGVILLIYLALFYKMQGIKNL